MPSPATDRLGAIAREHGVWLVVGVQEREPDGATIYNTLLYFSPDGTLVDKHRKLVPDRLRAHGVGDGRRVDPARRRHAVRTRSVG